MIDQIGAITCTAAYATMVGVLVALSPISPRHRRLAIAAAAAWGGMIVAVAASGGFAPGVVGPVPGPGIAFLGLLALLLAGWQLLPGFRNALLAVPLAALIALNATRVFGVFFLLLAAEGRLSSPFAPSAGWGDVATSLLAVPLAIVAWRHAGRVAGLIAAWNVFGALDLVIAIALGVLSAPSTPFQVFTEGAGTTTMGELPWALVPSMLVPLYLLVHLMIAAKLRAAPGRIAGAVTAG
ncbi:MAG: hypothetical protein IH626_19910 [Rhodospirillales bacterium]|nr:hypothetical protein [Rhodospirillales bacterium]